MKNLRLECFGVQEMNMEELVGVEGGIDITKLVKGGVWSYVITQAIEHWGEIKAGFREGYNAQI